MAHSCGRPESRWCKDTRPGKRSHSWMEYPPFLIGNTNLHSGSIFRPAMLNYRSVFFRTLPETNIFTVDGNPPKSEESPIEVGSLFIPLIHPIIYDGFFIHTSQVGFSPRISGCHHFLAPEN